MATGRRRCGLASTTRRSLPSTSVPGAIFAPTARAAARIEAAPARRPFPAAWRPDLQAHPVGTVIFIRRSSEVGAVGLLGRTFGVDALWPHRLVRCEMNLNAQSIRFHALRRREPHHQPLLHEALYS